MSSTISASVVGRRPAENGSGLKGRGSCSAPRRKRKPWLFALAALLAVAGLVTGSLWFGFAAVLPLLYLLPFLFMAAMCMKKCKTADPAGESAGKT